MLLEELCYQVKEQQEKVNRLHSLRSTKKELKWIMSKQELEHLVVPREGRAESVLIKLGNRDSLDGEGWELQREDHSCSTCRSSATEQGKCPDSIGETWSCVQ